MTSTTIEAEAEAAPKVQCLQVQCLQEHSQPQSRKQRTMSCPARLTQQEKIFRGQRGSNFGLYFSDFKRDFVSTIKTLAMLFLYLVMSSPLYVSTVLMHRQVGGTEYYGQLAFLVVLFYYVYLVGLVIYPYMWLWLDRQLAKKIKRIYCNCCANKKKVARPDHTKI